jgi:hypothetical protein
MKYSESVTTHDISIAEEPLNRRIRRKSIFARIINALHIPRRRQARRVIHRHRFLIAPDFCAKPAVVDFEASKSIESNINANGNKTPVVANDRALADGQANPANHRDHHRIRTASSRQRRFG